MKNILNQNKNQGRKDRNKYLVLDDAEKITSEPHDTCTLKITPAQ